MNSEATKCPCCLDKRFLCFDPRLFPGNRIMYMHFPDDKPWITTRCPLCIDLQRAVDDRELGDKYWADEHHPEMLERYKIIRAAIVAKFPEWKEDPHKPLYDSFKMQPTPEGQHCEMCNDQRVICPGCGARPTMKFFMGCGVDLRCPACVDYKGALEDRLVFDRYYDRQSWKPFQDQIKKVIAAVKAKFPDWKPDEFLQVIPNDGSF